MKVNLPLYKELLEDKRLNLITQINTTKNFTNFTKIGIQVQKCNKLQEKNHLIEIKKN